MKTTTVLNYVCEVCGSKSENEDAIKVCEANHNCKHEWVYYSKVIDDYEMEFYCKCIDVCGKKKPTRLLDITDLDSDIRYKELKEIIYNWLEEHALG